MPLKRGLLGEENAQMSMSGTKSTQITLPIMTILKAALMVALLPGLLAVFSGCRRSSSPQQDNDTSPTKNVSQQASLASYFPLTVGSTWSYLGEGMEYASFTREVVFVRGRRGQLQEDNGGTVIAAVYEISDDAITRIYHSAEAYEAEDLLDRIPASESEQIVILRTPLKTGTTWQTPGNETRTITATDAIVETPAGTFENCVAVKIESEHSTLHEYFKEGIGLVLREFVSEGYRVTSTLEEYDIK